MTEQASTAAAVETFNSFIVRYTFSQIGDFARYYFKLRDPSPESKCCWVAVRVATPESPQLDPTLFSLLLDAFRSGNAVDLAIGKIKKQISDHPFGPREGEKVAALKAISLPFNF